MTPEPLRIRFLLREVDERRAHLDLELLSVSMTRGVIPRSALTDDEPRADDLGNYKVCHPGDIVVNRMSAYQGALGMADQDGIVSPDYIVFRPSAIAWPRWLHHLMRSSWFVSEMSARIRGIGSIGTGNVRTPRVSASEIGEIKVVVPNLTTQRAIADYLDVETARIDALIAKKQRMIELTQEAFRSVLQEVFQEPSRVPLKRLVRFQEGPGIMANDFRDEGVPLVRVSGVGGPYVTLDGCNYLDPDKVRVRWEHFSLDEGDYLISASASMGIASRVGPEAVGAIPYTGLIRFKPIAPDLRMELVRFFLISPDFERQIDLLKTGAAMQHFGPSHLGEVTVPDIFDSGHTAVAEALVAKDGVCRRTCDLLSHQIDLLRERRQALITAVVTGEMSVPGVAT